MIIRYNKRTLVHMNGSFCLKILCIFGIIFYGKILKFVFKCVIIIDGWFPIHIE